LPLNSLINKIVSADCSLPGMYVSAGLATS
jgi:hypothetical protein